jgi:PAS domain S-box-containing protein
VILTDADILQARILIVDDQSSNVQLLEQLLDAAGYSAVTATTEPQQVCALHLQHGYDLILLDLQMPLMDGFEVMAALKAQLINDYLPVIVLTAQPAHKLRALQSGAKDFISKPFDLIEVKTRIRNMLEVRLLYKKLEEHNRLLETKVAERTAELRQSEARYRSLTELASDWYWEQDENGQFTKVSGPVMDMLGIATNNLAEANFTEAKRPEADGWNLAEWTQLHASIAARQPFIDFAFSRTLSNGVQKYYRVSGEPMFDQSCRFMGYRGIGVECEPKIARPYTPATSPEVASNVSINNAPNS